jgi:U3 small nucleolar RNA-associated protein 6
MLAELKDFGEKGIFSAKEIKHIVKKRTTFETALVRRIPNKNDYLRYAAYEMGLEALRRKRVARLSGSLPPHLHPFLFYQQKQ